MISKSKIETADDKVLSIQDVAVSYGKQKVINGVSLDITSGETFGLIGLNGVGKTTLIKTILGLRGVNGGSIVLNGGTPGDVLARQVLAYLPERFDPPSFLTGLEFIKFSLSLYGVKLDKDKAVEGAKALALDPDALNVRVNTYSKGMRQKVGLLATFMTGCELLILDEPMSGLDPKARALVKDMFHKAKAQGRTIFLSSHILSDMNEICDRVAVLTGGNLRYLGTPEGLRKQGKSESLEKAFLNVLEAA